MVVIKEIDGFFLAAAIEVDRIGEGGWSARPSPSEKKTRDEGREMQQQG